jgi:hypothetical protein
MKHLITQEFLDKLTEVQRLLVEAYEHYFEHGDGHCKSSEGAIDISLPPFFWREGEDREPAVEVYSYVLGPSRSHWFNTIDDALAEVRKWHAAEMAETYDDEGMFA